MSTSIAFPRKTRFHHCAAIGIAVTNFNQGGRLAVVQGNLIRNLSNKRPAGMRDACWS